MNTNIRAFYMFAVLVLFVLMLAGCASSPEAQPLVATQSFTEQPLEAPITQRYPALEFQPATEAISLNTEPKAIADYFSCNDQEVSTITDDIPLIDVSFIEADIMDAVLELSLLTGISIITDDSIGGMVSVNFVGKSLDEVLEAIIAPGNYGYKKYDSFIYVGSQSPGFPFVSFAV